MERDPLRTHRLSPSRIAGLATLLAALSPALAHAQDAAPVVNQADTAWMLIATALVLLMTPALGFFYGGLVRSKNSLNTMMMSYIALAFVGVAWALIVFSLAFAPGNDYVGDLSQALLRNIGLGAQSSAALIPQ